MTLKKLLLKTHCQGCGRPTVIKREEKRYKECKTCQVLGVERSRAEWLTLNKLSDNTEYGVKHEQALSNY